MKGRKILYLVVALLFPIGVFLFLKFFGKNEFSVAPLFQTEEELPITHCNYTYAFPYSVPDSIWTFFQTNHRTKLVVFAFIPEGPSATEGGKLLRRTEETFSHDPVLFKTIVEGEGGPVDIDFIRRCIFLLPDNVSVVVVDGTGRIRGQYDAASLDEMDRMVVELKIILGKY
jgi:hypothetical protein